MKTAKWISLFIMAGLLASAHAQDATDELSLDGPETNIGEKTDLGTPDPLNAEEPPAPEILDLGESEESVAPVANPPAPAPEAPAPEIAVDEPKEEPAPVPLEISSEPPRGEDSPDFRRERNYHNIYRKYNQDPTPADQWEQAAGGRRSEIYKIQNGDTLWDLSKTFFGQPDFWPKLWALNKEEVTNPHQIETWMQIRFYPGTLQEAPTLAVAPQEPVAPPPPAPLAQAESPADENGNFPAETPDSALIPKPKKRAPLVKVLPNSLPLYRPLSIRIPPTNFEGLTPPPVVGRARATLSYYVADAPPGGVGVIREAEAGGPTAMEYQYVYVEMSNPPKGVYSVLKDIGHVQDKKDLGRVVEVQGEIEVMDEVGDGLYRAIVKKSLAPIDVGAVIVPGSLEVVNTEDGVPVQGPSLQVIGAQFGTQRNIVDADGIVFLNGGSDEGLQVGQVYGVYADRQTRNANTKVKSPGDLIGHLRIAKVASHFATAFVTKMNGEILIGDRVGGGGGGFPAAALEIGTPAASSESPDELELEADSASGVEDEGDLELE